MEQHATRGRPTYALRLGLSERRMIEAAAIALEEPMSAYVRRVAIEAAQRDLAATHTPANR